MKTQHPGPSGPKALSWSATGNLWGVFVAAASVSSSRPLTAVAAASSSHGEGPVVVEGPPPRRGGVDPMPSNSTRPALMSETTVLL